MNAAPAPSSADWKLPSPRKLGIISLIVAESALFTIFVVAYLFYINKSLSGPLPKDVLEFPLLSSLALFSSSATIFIAEKFLRVGKRVGFLLWWGLTIALGLYFLYCTGREWSHLIVEKDLTICTNVFGTTFYSLVGLHAFHVIVGVLLLAGIWISSLHNALLTGHVEHVESISYYWHFVDCIWIIVLTVVYVLSVQATP